MMRPRSPGMFSRPDPRGCTISALGPGIVTLTSRVLVMGSTVGHVGSVSGRGRFVSLLSEGHLGTIVERFDMRQGRDRVFVGIAAAAHDWDGRDPMRTTLPTG